MVFTNLCSLFIFTEALLLPETAASVVPSRASVLLASDCIYDSGLLRFVEKKLVLSTSRRLMQYVSFVTARSDACQPAAFH